MTLTTWLALLLSIDLATTGQLLLKAGLDATGVTVAVLFVEELLSADLQRVAATTFILAVGLMMWALVLFLRETQAASAALRIPDEYLEPDRRI